MSEMINSKSNDGSVSIGKDFFRYVSLNIIGMIGMSFYILADTFFIAKALGAVGLASLNFAISMHSIMQGLSLMIGIGGATLFAIEKERGNRESGNVAFTHSIISGCVVAAIFVVIAMFFTNFFATMLGADEFTLQYTVTYLKTIFSFAPFFVANYIILAFVRNDGSPRLSMTAMLVSSFSNIVLDYVFIFPCNLGMFGAAFATGLSPIISLLILSIHFFRKKNTFRLIKCEINFSKMKKIMSLGFSSFISELASAISLITFNLIILNLAGNVGVAAYGIVANIALVMTAIFIGISQGIQPLASKYCGKGDKKTVMIIMKYTIISAIVLWVGSYALTYSNAEWIVSVFNGENNSQLAVYATEGVKLYFFGYLFGGINIVASALLSATFNQKKGMTVAILRSTVILIPAVAIMSTVLGMQGIWLSFVITELLVICVSIFSLSRLKI